MRVVNYSSLRANLKQELDRVISDSDVTIVARNGEGSNVVIMSEEVYRSWHETQHLISSPKNRNLLLEAIKGLNNGEGIERGLIE